MTKHFKSKAVALEALEKHPLACVTWHDGNGTEMAAIYWNGKRCIQPANKKINWSKKAVDKVTGVC